MIFEMFCIINYYASVFLILSSAKRKLECSCRGCAAIDLSIVDARAEEGTKELMKPRDDIE